MKILAISDEPCDALWEYYTPGRLKDYDLIISSGDLKAGYLSFLVTMARCPLLYVHGNHDESYAKTPPEGCDCIDDQFVVYNGVRILGLGGCPWYHPGQHQYTERQMRRRIRRLRYQLWKHKGVDIVVTHAPPQGVGDLEDRTHRGFEAFLELIDRYHPQYLLHGHVHLRYSHGLPREHSYNGTRVINVCERYTLEVPEKEHPQKHHNELQWKTRPPKTPTTYDY